ncbi:MAG TPA: alpha/beta hydrolase [Streptosporangiaceae bacterium]|nr:alpha/beta hydrolase [Streptosporangiaceae bacterium]
MTAELTEPPSWFAQALAAPVVLRTVRVAGTEIAYRQFGSAGSSDSSGIVLVHGGAAHARWWDHIAPLLATERRVVAVDLSGHGDSGRKDSYTLDGWADEVMAVAADASLTDSPVIVGHSMGGFVALRAAGMYGTELAGIVVIDSPVQDLTPEQQAAREGRAFGPLRVYPSREAAIARFRPMPDQPTLPYVRAHVAATSIRAVDGGWAWKFDPAVFSRSAATPALLRHLDCRVALFHAEHGIVPPQTTELMYDKLGQLAPVIEIPAAGHHVMLDQPIALVTGIRTLLSDWDHSMPARPAAEKARLAGEGHR